MKAALALVTLGLVCACLCVGVALAKVNGKKIKGGYYEVRFKPTQARYLRLVALSEVSGQPWTSGAELYAVGSDGKILNRKNWKIVKVDSWEAKDGNKAENLIDGKSNTIWHTEYSSKNPKHPHEVQIDLGSEQNLKAIRYLPRSGQSNGTIKNYALYLSNDTKNWGKAVAQGVLVKGGGKGGGKASAQPPAGFVMTRYASPPDINYPTCITAAATGEVLVGIDPDGSLGKRKGFGKVVMCMDTDNDGKADKFIEFAKMDHPRGMFYDNGSLWVLYPPTLAVFRDTDGDHKADTTEILVKGLSTDFVKKRGADHTTNGFVMGIDGWIYIAVGDFGFVAAEGTDGKKVQLLGGGIARVRPDGTELEIYVRGQRNIYDVAMDPYLNAYTRDNTNDGGGWNVRVSHLIGGNAHYGYPMFYKKFPEDMIHPLKDYGGGSGTGALFVHEPGSFPKGFDDALYTCDWGRSIVFVHRLPKKGSTFSDHQENFLGIPRPTDMTVDGLGRMYIASWAGGGFSFKGPNVGYVVQLNAEGYKPRTFPDLPKASEPDLLKYLASRSHKLRQHTQWEMLRRGAKPALVSGLEKMAVDASASLGSRVAAIFTLKQMLGVKSHAALLKIAKTDDVREFALRALADRKTQLEGLSADPFIAALRDADLRVQLSAVIALGRLGNKEAATALIPMAGSPEPLIAHAAVKQLVMLNAVETCLAAVDTTSSTTLDGVLRALQEMHEAKTVEGLASRVIKHKSPAKKQAILRTLIRLYHTEGKWTGSWWGTRPDNRGPYYKLAKWDQSEAVAQAVRAGVASADAQTTQFVSKELARQRVPIKDLPKAGSIVTSSTTQTPEIVVKAPKVDKNNKNLIGNMPFDSVLSGVLKTKGDAKLGKQLFTRQNCAACHTVSQSEKPRGPYLGAVTVKYKRNELTESILKPNAVLAQGFQTVVFQLKNGKVKTGFVTMQAADETHIRTITSELIVLKNSQVEARKQLKTSSMPEGLANNLTLHELASLLAYLESLAKK